MWINRCKILLQRCFIHVGNIKTKYPDRSFGLSNRTNHFSCQQTERASSSVLCFQTGLLIRNCWMDAYFHPSLVRRLMSNDCKGKPPVQEDPICKSSKKPSVKGNTKTSIPTFSAGNSLIINDRQVCQNFHQKCVEKINAQINDELFAAYTYICMASFCTQDNVALGGFAKFFTHSYREEIEHMEKFIAYLNKRGGQLLLTAIAAPPKHEWKQAEELVSDALHMEMSLNDRLLQLHICAAEHCDAHLTDFLEEHYLQEQVDAIKVLADLLTTLQRARKELSVHLVDRELQGDGFSLHGNGKWGRFKSNQCRQCIPF